MEDTEYVAFGNDNKPLDLAPRISREADPKSGFFNRMGRAISPNTRSGRSNLSPRSFVGSLSPEERPKGIYDTNDVNLPTISQFELDESDKKTANIRAEKAQAMAREAYEKELEEIKKQEKAEKKSKSNCKKELRGCYMNCKAPGYRSKYDCDECTDKIMDRVNSGQSACDENVVSHYKADCDKHCREGRTAKKIQAKLGNKKARELLKKREGSYSDNLLQENEDRKRSRFILRTLGSVAAKDRVKLIDRPDGTDALGNFQNPKFRSGPFAWNGGPDDTTAIGGARRRRRTNRRRTKRRKPKKSKKSKRTRRTRRQRR